MKPTFLDLNNPAAPSSENQSQPKIQKETKKNSDLEHLESELHLALEEVAHLHNALAEANMKLAILPSQKNIVPRLQNNDQGLISELLVELTPLLTTISSYADLLASQSVGQLGPLQLRFAERINHSIEQVQNIVAEYSNHISLTKNQMAGGSGSCSLTEIVQVIISRKSDLLQKKQIALQLMIPSSLPDVIGSTEEITQIVEEFLVNAIEVTPAQEIIHISLAIQEINHSIFELLVIGDSGPGIPANLLATLFSLHGAQVIPGCSVSRTQLFLLKQQIQDTGGVLSVETAVRGGCNIKISFLSARK